MNTLMRSVTPEADLPIWQRASLYPEKPVGAAYGYVPYKGPPVGAQSLEQLKVAIAMEAGGIYGVWRPEVERVMPAAEAPELLEELRPRRVSHASSRFKSSRLNLLIFTCVFLPFLYSGIMEKGWRFYEAQGLGMLSIFLVSFGLSPFYEAWKSLKSARKLDASSLKEEAREIRFGIWMDQQRAHFTRALTFIIIGLAIFQVMKGGGFSRTADIAGLKQLSQMNGEFWRIWTAPFLHGSTIHIVFNASSLWYLGKRVEVLTKWPHLLMAFILSAVLGACCSMYFLPESAVGVGASGGIMGLLGFLLTFELMHPKLTPKPARRRLIVAIVFMAIIGIAGVSFIDNAAHAGGLLAGALYAFISFKKSSSAKRPELLAYDWVIGVGALLLILRAIVMTYVSIT